MNSFICAIATDDEKNYTDSHFGDARYYRLYEFTSSSAEYLKIIANTTQQSEPENHADPGKASNVVELLNKEDVKVVVANIFGPNIKRIKSKFVCILMDNGSISKSIPHLLEQFEVICDSWNSGNLREHLNLRKRVEG